MPSARERAAVRRLATARLISLTGSGAAFAALAYIMFQLTGESRWVSWTLLLTFGAQGLFAPLGSALGDRFDRRKVLVFADLAAAVGFVALAFAQTPAQLLVMAFVTATLESPIWSVSAAAVPNLVGPEDLTWANGMVAVGRNIGNLVGPILGGVLVAVIAPDSTPEQLQTAGYWVFGLNAVSFAGSAWLIGTTPGSFTGERGEDHRFGSLKDGVVFLLRDRVLRAITLAWVVLLLGAGFTLVAEVALAEELGAGAIGYGLLNAGWGGGAALGSFLAQRRLRERHEARALIWGVVFVGLCLGLIGVAPWLPLAVGLMVGAGTGEGIGGVAEQGILQRRTPDHVRSRVIGASESAILIALAISFAFGGEVVDALGPRGAFLIGGLSCLVAALVLVRPLGGEHREAAMRDVTV
ncbi:MAG: MFS transporter [Actinomycetota bacterium]